MSLKIKNMGVFFGGGLVVFLLSFALFRLVPLQKFVPTDSTIIIGPGTKIRLNGKPTPVVGYNFCGTRYPRDLDMAPPNTIPAGEFGVGDFGCVVVRHDTTSVIIEVPSRRGFSLEHWQVVRHRVTEHFLGGIVREERVSLIRPNGQRVVWVQ